MAATPFCADDIQHFMYEQLLDDDVSSVLDLIDSRRETWRRDAACRGYPTGWWFPERGQSNAEAKAICAVCPVIDECADYAATFPTNVLHGVWAGSTGRSRRRSPTGESEAA